MISVAVKHFFLAGMTNEQIVAAIEDIECCDTGTSRERERASRWRAIRRAEAETAAVLAECANDREIDNIFRQLEEAEKPDERRGIPKRLRNYIFGRDGSSCRYCGNIAEHCDHVIPVVKGGDNHPDNLVAACAPCNLSKGSKTLAEWGRELLPVGALQPNNEPRERCLNTGLYLVEEKAQ
jgi:hypothetical protein